MRTNGVPAFTIDVMQLMSNGVRIYNQYEPKIEAHTA